MSKRVSGARVALPMLLSLTLMSAALPWAAAQAAIEASAAWTRATPPGIAVAVGYLTLKNTSKGRRGLLKITSPNAEMISLHQSSVDANGVSHMWPIAKLELEPGEVMKFAPNGRHLMLQGLTSPLRKGMRIAVTFVFEDEDPVTVELEVQPLVDEHAGRDAHAGHDAHADHH